jgi:hypothetical protein
MYHINILLGDFIAEVGGEDIFKPTVCNKSLHEINNDNSVRDINLAISKNLIFMSTIFPHCSVYKYTWTFRDGKTHIQFGRILINKIYY